MFSANALHCFPTWNLAQVPLQIPFYMYVTEYSQSILYHTNHNQRNIYSNQHLDGVFSAGRTTISRQYKHTTHVVQVLAISSTLIFLLSLYPMLMA